MHIGLIELPALKLLDESGLNWTALRQREPLGSKQILASQLAAHGYDVGIVNLKAGSSQVDIGQLKWREHKLTKIAVGTPWLSLDPGSCDVWGLTVNYLQEREVACAVIQHLKTESTRIVVGGSDAYAEPARYLRAGADVVVRDKSGAANIPALEFVAGRCREDGLRGVMLPDERVLPRSRPPMHPQDWPLPPEWIVRATVGTDYWEAPISQNLKPIGSVMLDIGCDRHCDFCETPLYGVGYKSMKPERAIEWLRLQAAAGAKSVIILSDQFLGRVLRPGGREEICAILDAARAIRLPVLWGNGVELRKATRGRSLPNGDLSVDEDLVAAVWGWDGEVGCAQAYIPAERPLAGPEAFTKLMPWGRHCEMMEAVVSAGVPDINYGLIIGLPDDSDRELGRLTEGIGVLKSRLKAINPHLVFRVTPYAIRPIPGTPQTAELAQQGLIRFEDPSILGGFWTACADTRHLPYQEVSNWQRRMVQELSDPGDDWQGITALA